MSISYRFLGLPGLTGLAGLVTILSLSALTTTHAAEQAAAAPVGANFKRLINGKEATVKVECAAAVKETDQCLVTSKKVDGKVVEDKVPLEKVRRIVDGFFDRVTNSGMDVSRTTASLDFFQPENATFSFAIQSKARKAQGGFTLQDIDSIRPDRQMLMEAVRDVEMQLSGTSKTK